MATLIRRRRADGSLSYRVQDRTTGYPSLSETFSTLKMAREFRRKVEHEREAGIAGLRRGRHRLAEAVADFTTTAEFRKRKSGATTRRQLEWWSGRIGQLPLAKITPDLIADQLHTLEAEGRSGSTVNRYRSALSRLFRYAVNTRRWTDHNPCSMIERRPEGRRRERVITAKEWDRLLNATLDLAKRPPKRNIPTAGRKYAPRAQLPNFLRVTYGTAARSGDVRFLRWEYVDLKHRLVTFHDPKAGNGYTVPLMGDSLAAIREQAKLRRKGCPWVFPSRVTDNAPPWFHSAFRVARKAAKLTRPDARGEVLTIHHLRHSAATEAGRGGASAFEVQAMTGHRTLAMVQRYTKTDELNALAAMKKRARGP
jgi:integrase